MRSKHTGAVRRSLSTSSFEQPYALQLKMTLEKKTWKKCHLWLSKHQHATQNCCLWSFKQGLLLHRRPSNWSKNTAVAIESGLLWCRLCRVTTTCNSFLGTWKSKPRRHDATLSWKFLIIKVGGISYNNLKVWLKYTFTTKHSRKIEDGYWKKMGTENTKTYLNFLSHRGVDVPDVPWDFPCRIKGQRLQPQDAQFMFYIRIQNVQRF